MVCCVLFCWTTVLLKAKKLGGFMARFLRCLLVGVLGIGATLAYASTELSEEQYRASVCAIASQGAFTAAVARQKNLPIEEAKALLDARLEVLAQSFSNRVFLVQIAEVWSDDLEHVYTMDILPDNEDKAVFATMLEELSFSACMNKEPNIAL